MSLTNIVYTPVDTGTAKISFNVENAKVMVFYLLAGKLTPQKPGLRRTNCIWGTKVFNFCP